MSRTIPSGPDLALVEKYSKPRPRWMPPVFVGREEVVKDIEATCREAMEAVSDDRESTGRAPGLTTLVQGAPGAGKTSLLEHMEDRWEGRKDAPLAVRIPIDVLRNLEKLAEAVMECVVPSEVQLLGQSPASVAESKGDVSLLSLIPNRWVKKWFGRKAPPKATFGQLARRLPPSKWKRPLCIFVDEIQEADAAHRDCILELHLAHHGLPIVPVYAGLANSGFVLDDLGLSRIDPEKVWTLERLSDPEVEAYVEGMLRNCRIPSATGRMDGIAGRIADRSEGWPLHVHTETAAMFWGLHRAGCDLSRVEWEAVEERARRYRDSSYKARQSTEMKLSKCLVAAVMKEVPEDGGMDMGTVDDIIAKRHVPGGPSNWRLPAGMDEKQFRCHLIRKGVLQPAKGSLLTCPIPSLRTWLIRSGAPREAAAGRDESAA